MISKYINKLSHPNKFFNAINIHNQYTKYMGVDFLGQFEEMEGVDKTRLIG